MSTFHQLEARLRDMSPLQATGLFLGENLLIFAGAVASGHLLVKLFRERRVAPEPAPIAPAEIAFTASTIVLNTAVTLAGWWMWRNGLVRLRSDTAWRAWLDVLVLLLVMDAAMYVMHRLAHIAMVYPIVHRTHHRYDKPHPLSLFVLNPFEALGFGALWLIVIRLYSASWLGMSLYLGLNVLWGMVGHLGVEPLPDSWQHAPLLNWLSTSTFHAQHHLDPVHNFGFYTLIWDRLLGTLSPHYDTAFGRLFPLMEEGSA